MENGATATSLIEAWTPGAIDASAYLIGTLGAFVNHYRQAQIRIGEFLPRNYSVE